MLKSVSITADAVEEQFMHTLRDRMDSLEHVLHHLSENAAEIADILEWLTAACSDEPGHHPSHVGHHHSRRSLHQDLCRQEKVYRLPLLILESHLLTRDEHHVQAELADPARRRVYSACFAFLTAFVADNAKNRAALSTHAHFAFIANCFPHNIGADRTLARLVAHNPHAIDEHVNEEFLVHIAQHFFHLPSGLEAGFFDFLASVLSAHGYPDPTRQQSVIHHVLSDRRLPAILGAHMPDGDASRGKFAELIIKSFGCVDPNDQQPQHVSVFVSLVNLLNVCIDGGNLDALVRAQSLLPLPALLSLLQANLPRSVRSVFLTFAMRTYFKKNDEADVDTAGVESLAVREDAADNLSPDVLASQLNAVLATAGAEFDAMLGTLRGATADSLAHLKHEIDVYVADKVALLL